MSRRSVEQWRREVFRAPISPNVRLLLLFMAESMRERDKHVSIPRQTMAKGLGWTEPRVSERLKQAVEAGFLVSKSPGYRGHTAEYQGTWPDVPLVKSVRKISTQTNDQKTGRFSPVMRPENTDATSRAELPEVGTSRNEGADEEQVPRRSASEVTVCPWHRDDNCPPDCANAPDVDRRRSA